MYITGKGFKFVEEDDYKEGCLPHTAQFHEINVAFQAETVEDLVSQFKEFFNVEEDDIELNACDEAGRVDIQVMENWKGEKASTTDLNNWKKGKTTLYLAVYSYHVSKTEKIWL